MLSWLTKTLLAQHMVKESQEDDYYDLKLEYRQQASYLYCET